MDTNNTLHILDSTGRLWVRLLFCCVLGIVAISGGILASYAILGTPPASKASAARTDWSMLPTVTEPLAATSTIEQLASKMLGTNKSYQNLSAHLVSTLGDGRLVTDATMAVEQPNRFRVEAIGGDKKWIAVSDSNEVWMHHPNGKVQARENLGKLASPVLVVDPRPDHIIIPISGTDLPIGGAADTMIHPHSIVQGVFPTGLVQIKGMERIGSREGVVVEVGPDPGRPGDWAPKFGARRLYVVDARTGIVLRAEQFAHDGALQWRDILSDVVIDNPGFTADFSLRLAPGERLLDRGEEP